MNKKQKYIIECPNCNSTFDCSEDIERFKEELELTSRVLKQIAEIKIPKEKKVKDFHRKSRTIKHQKQLN